MTYGLRDIDGRVVELCDECGFDGREEIDLGARLAAGYSTLMQLVAKDGSQHRPAEDTWSGVEYGEHIVAVTAGIVGACRQALGRTEAPGVTDLAAARDAAGALAADLGPQEGEVGVDLWPFDATVLSACVHLLHDLEHHVLDVRRGLAALGLADGTDVVTTRR